MSKNDGRGMSPKEQRKLADDLGRTVQWLRTIGIKPKSTSHDIEVYLEEWYEADGERIESLRTNRRRARRAITDLYAMRIRKSEAAS